MSELGHRQHGPALDDARHPIVGRDAPLDGNRMVWHAAAVERLRGQPRPQHDAIGRRIAGSDTQCERVVANLLRRRVTRERERREGRGSRVPPMPVRKPRRLNTPGSGAVCE